jgi:phytoene dehydrogenase-like protein
MNPTVKVIGSGVGGLATAIRLASMGMHVTVYEKNSFVGGKVHSRTFNRVPSSKKYLPDSGRAE